MIKFSCEKVLLQNAISVTGRAVAQKSSIPALEGLLLRADHQLSVSGYNMQTGIRTTVPADVAQSGEIVLNARLFGDIIRRMPDDVVTISADEKMMVHLRCGDADFDILGLSAADYPDLPEVEDEYSVSLPQKTLRAMIEEVPSRFPPMRAARCTPALSLRSATRGSPWWRWMDSGLPSGGSPWRKWRAARFPLWRPAPPSTR